MSTPPIESAQPVASGAEAAVRVHFLTQGEDDPATRFRVTAFLPGLRALGFDVRADVIPGAGRGRRDLLDSLAASDVVFLQRRLFNLRDQSRLRERARHLIFDFDDSIMFKDGGRHSLTRSGRFSRMIRASDLVLAGNEYLRTAAAAYTRNVRVLPTVVDTDVYRPAARAEAPAGAATSPLVIGWLGSQSTVHYVGQRAAELGAAATRLAELGIAVQVEVVADGFGDLPERFGPAAVKRVPWSREEELAALSRFDVGIMPLPDDPWTRGKCGFKLLQYLATETAAVADAVGVNSDILAPTENGDPVGGLLATTGEDWVSAVVALGSDAALRQRAATLGRQRVEASYSVRAALAQLAPLLREVARAPARGSRKKPEGGNRKRAEGPAQTGPAT